jgi:PPOX class probable F420-dependent enzyme
LAFLGERHLGTLTTLRSDGTPHVVAIAFTDGAGRVQIITSEGTQKVRNVDRTGWAAVCQVDGPRWLTLEGPAHVVRDSDGIRRAVEAFERRYRLARINPNRVAIEMTVRRVLGIRSA